MKPPERNDDFSWLVYADWLDDNRIPGAEEIRNQIILPILPDWQFEYRVGVGVGGGGGGSCSSGDVGGGSGGSVVGGSGSSIVGSSSDGVVGGGSDVNISN